MTKKKTSAFFTMKKYTNKLTKLAKFLNEDNPEKRHSTLELEGELNFVSPKRASSQLPFQTAPRVTRSHQRQNAKRQKWIVRERVMSRFIISHCRTTDFDVTIGRCVMSDRNLALCAVLIKHKARSDGELKVCLLPQQLVRSNTVLRQCLTVDQGFKTALRQRPKKKKNPQRLTMARETSPFRHDESVE